MAASAGKRATVPATGEKLVMVVLDDDKGVIRVNGSSQRINLGNRGWVVA